jgi:hypothetical protein
MSLFQTGQVLEVRMRQGFEWSQSQPNIVDQNLLYEVNLQLLRLISAQNL